MKRLLAAAAGLALVGCTTLPPQMIDPTEQAKDPSTVNKQVDYPAGPYGYGIGSIIENLTLTGQSDDNASGIIDTADTVKAIRLSDYFADKKNKVLFIGAAAEWCGPCQQEQPGLVTLHDKYKDKGVVFLEALIQNVQGAPADIATVDRWGKRFSIPFDLACDPTVALGPYYPAPEFPMQVIVDLSNMKIAYNNNGTSANLDQELGSTFDSILANPGQ